MRTLQNYVARKNDWNKFFGGKPLDLNNAQDRQKVANSIDSDLSPENLTLDGERPRSQVQALYNELTKAAQELKALDPSVKFYEFA